MRTPAWLATFARIALVVAIPVILLASPLYLFVTPEYARYQYARPGFPLAERFNPVERARISDVILEYLRGRVSLEDMAAVRTDTGEIAMRPDEVQHLVDVKRVTDGFFIAHAVALVVAVASGVLLWYSDRRAFLYIYLRQGVWITGGMILLVLLSALLDFDLFFTRFHQIFFEEGTWIFWADDTLIQLYPLPFWVDTVQRIVAVIAIESALIYALSVLVHPARRLKRQRT
ncbi:MAG TPA: TIGR01906 family membrane protein [Chloroflexi bacterium]|jgi:integral membrane protein (TIGR01906 family)|nr:TIGR01906 family membrane protein [Chloroflexota bacterium]